MTRAAALVLLLAGLGLSACAGVDATDVSTGGVDAGAPAPLAGHDWFYDDGDGEAVLLYGLAESDDVWFDLSCRRGAGRLAFSRPAPAGAPERIALESGGATETYPARSASSDLHDGVILSASAPASDPVFVRFRQTGWLAVLDGEARRPMAPQPDSADRVARFFAFCG